MNAAVPLPWPAEMAARVRAQLPPVPAEPQWWPSKLAHRNTQPPERDDDSRSRSRQERKVLTDLFEIRELLADGSTCLSFRNESKHFMVTVKQRFSDNEVRPLGKAQRDMSSGTITVTGTVFS